MLFSFSGLAQEPFYWQLTEEDGLPSMTVYQVHQDKKGFMWFGTENGICRYDGKEMETYYHNDLLDNEILKIQEDSLGRIWFMNLAGQLGFVYKSKITLITLSIKLKEFCISNNFLFGRSNQEKGFFIKYKINLNGTLTVKYKEEQIGLYNSSPMVEKDGIIYFCTKSINKKQKLRIYRFDYSNDDLLKFKYKEPTSFLIYPSLLTMFQKDKGIISTPANQSIEFKIRKDSFFFHHQPRDFYTYGLLQKKSKKEIVTRTKILTYEIETILNEVSFTDLTFNKGIVDNEDNVWLITNKNGIIIIPKIHITFFNSKNSEITNNSIYSIIRDNKNDIITGNGKGTISIINNDTIYSKNLFPEGRVRAIGLDNNNNLWLGGDKIYLSCFNSDFSKTITINNEYAKKIPSGVFTGIKSITIDENNNILIGTFRATFNFNLATFDIFKSKMEFQAVRNIDGNLLGYTLTIDGVRKEYPFFIHERTYATLVDNATIWLGTTKGVYRRINNVNYPLLENNVHIPYSVSSIVQSQDSTIWVSTQAHGVIGIKNDSVIHRITKESGLLTNNCSKLFYDEFNNLWIGTKKGLHKLDLDNFEIDIINKYDGLPTNEITALYAEDSTLWIGTLKGLVKMPYSAIQKNKTSPPIYITKVKFWEKDTTLLSSYELQHDQNNITIEYVGLTYRNRGNTNYKYRLLGVDSNWVSSDTRSVRYPFLNPGEYEFQVKAINEDGVESTAPEKIKIIIFNPWWKTWWFYAFVTLSVIAIIGSFFYRKIQRVRKEEQQKKEFDEKINELRMMALQAQMNPHFIFNALSAIQKFLTTDEQESAVIYLARFAQLIRNIFEQSKEKLITLEEEIDFLKLYLDLEKLRFQDKIVVKFQVDNSIQDDDYDIQIPPLLIQPIVENAFKHGLMHREKGGELKIRFSKNQEYLFCQIEDNGVGRVQAKLMGEDKLKRHRPSGLKTAKERLEILNEPVVGTSHLTVEDLMNSNKEPIGTKVQIQIRYNNL